MILIYQIYQISLLACENLRLNGQVEINLRFILSIKRVFYLLTSILCSYTSFFMISDLKALPKSITEHNDEKLSIL